MRKISIILYTYNAIYSIEKILVRLRNQSLRDFSCYVVDGGSTDRTCAVAEGYSVLDNRFALIRTNDLEKYEVYNNILDNLACEFCIFLDQYDIPTDDFLQNIYDLAKKNNADIAQYYEENKENINNQIYIKNPLNAFIQVLKYGAESPYLIKSSVIGTNRFKGNTKYDKRLFILECISNSRLIVENGCHLLYEIKERSNDKHVISKGVLAQNSLDAIIRIMTYVQRFNNGLHIYALQHTIIETLNIAEKLDNLRSKSQRKALEYSKQICRTYSKWFIFSKDINFKLRYKALIMCISYRLYNILNLSGKNSKKNIDRHKIYISAKDKRLDRQSSKAYLKQNKIKESDK